MPSAASQSALSRGVAGASKPRPRAAARLKSPRRAPGLKQLRWPRESENAKCHVPGCPARLRTHGQERRQRPQGRGEARENEANTLKGLEDPFELLLAAFFYSWEAENWQEKQTANFYKVSFESCSYRDEYLAEPSEQERGTVMCGEAHVRNFSCRPSPEEALLWAEAFDELLASKCKFIS